MILKSRVAVLDCESTGFPSNPSASVIDVAAILLDLDGTEIACFESLVRPIGWGPWAEDARKIHGIEAADVADAPAPGTVAADLEEWLRAHECRFVTAYNVAFDEPMLTRMGLRTRFPGDLSRPLRITWADCVMVRAAKIMGPAGVLRDADPSHPRYRPDLPWLFPPLAPNPKSGLSACEFFGVEPVLPAHRARADVATAVRVLMAMMARTA